MIFTVSGINSTYPNPPQNYCQVTITSNPSFIFNLSVPLQPQSRLDIANLPNQAHPGLYPAVICPSVSSDLHAQVDLWTIPILLTFYHSREYGFFMQWNISIRVHVLKFVL